MMNIPAFIITVALIFLPFALIIFLIGRFAKKSPKLREKPLFWIALWIVIPLILLLYIWLIFFTFFAGFNYI